MSVRHSVNSRTVILACLLAIIVLVPACGSSRSSTKGPQAPSGQIVFSSRPPGQDNQVIYAVQADGSQMRALTQHPDRSGMNPVVSPDGKKVAYEAEGMDTATKADIYVIDLAGENALDLTRGVGQNREPAWSPDSQQIVFSRFQNDQAKTDELFIVKADGTGLRQLTHIAEVIPAAASCFASASEPAWSPDGSRIAFNGGIVGGYGDLYVINVDGTGLQALTNTPQVNEDNFKWSPDGSQILFESWDGDGEVMAINADGSGLRNVTNNDDEDSDPAWSPDGRQIAYISWGQLWVINADGTNLKQIESHQTINYSVYDPTWSPDGQWILFGRDVDGNKVYLFAVRPDGKNIQPVAGQINRRYYSPAWVPGSY